MKRTTAAQLVASVWALGATMALGLATPHAHADLVVVVNPDGSSDLYDCAEDSPPPCVWDCTTMGNRVCGGGEN